MLVLLLLVNPYLFGVNSLETRLPLVAMMFFSTFAIPAFAVFLMKALGMIESFQMHDRTERIGPFIVTGIFYMWMAFYCYNSPLFPKAYTIAITGATIALFLAFMINLFSKISLHAVGMGGLIGMIVITKMMPYSYDYFNVNLGTLGIFQVSLTSVLLLIFLLAGIVGTARLMLGAHEPRDLYGGYAIGFLAQFTALRFLY